MTRLAIFGAGGHGGVAADIAESVGWGSIEFYDDSDSLQGGCVHSWAVVGKLKDLLAALACYDGVFVAIGDNCKRNYIISILVRNGANIVSLIHPGAFISRYSSIGLGVVVMPGAVINIGAAIGVGSIVNSNASIEHDCTLSEAVHVSPGACLGGGVNIGDYSWIGLGASVKNNVNLGANTVVGSGAVVVNDFPDGGVVVGVPAKLIKNISS